MVFFLRPKPVSDWKFKKEWNDFYPTGDLYATEKQKFYREEWAIQTNSQRYPYLDYIKTISPGWRPLQYLADFMEIGTDPLRWRDFNNADKQHKYSYPDDDNGREEKRSERARRTQVYLLDYEDNPSSPDVTQFESPDDLREKLKEITDGKGHSTASGLKLFVVEDLSRDIIDHLGHYLQIEPDFFRSHVREHAWFNIRDPFWVPPSLHMDVANRSWHQIFFCRARYFSNITEFRKAQTAVNSFNIKRKLDEDESKALWDRSYTPKKQIFPRLNARYFSRRRKRDEEVPEKRFHGDRKSINANGGLPLDSMATMNERLEFNEEEVDAKVGLMRTKATFWWKGTNIGVLLLDPTLTQGFPLWREQENWHEKPIPGDDAPQFPNPEFSFLERFIYWAENPAPFLRKASLSNDPRQLPMMILLRIICADWLTMSQYIKTRLSQVDWELIHPREFLGHHRFYTILNKLHTWRRLVPVYREMLSTTRSHMKYFLNCSNQEGDFDVDGPFMEYENEFNLILKEMNEYEKRIDRLTAVTTSTINMVDSHRVKILTGLATVFLPLSFIGTLFSMSEDVGKLGATFGYWAAASVFVMCLLLIVDGLSQTWLA